MRAESERISFLLWRSTHGECKSSQQRAQPFLSLGDE